MATVVLLVKEELQDCAASGPPVKNYRMEPLLMGLPMAKELEMGN